MELLPSKKHTFYNHQKLYTYHILSDIGCPVLKSALVLGSNCLTNTNVQKIKDHFNSDLCMARYQYIMPNSSPIRGGNLVELHYNSLIQKLTPNTYLWLFEPVNRLTNNYGINLFFNRTSNNLVFECVGRGFDVASINRGDISPHEIIQFRLPIEYGWYNEWWKYAKFDFVSEALFEKSKHIRLKKLNHIGLTADIAIFDRIYRPLPYSQIEKLLMYCDVIDNEISNESVFVVSCSILENQEVVFWDISTPSGKMRILKNG